jgi:hypothetical protein
VSFSSGIGVKFAQSSSSVKHGPTPEEMFQTLLTNEKQGNLDKYTPFFYYANANCINREKYTFLRY